MMNLVHIITFTCDFEELWWRGVIFGEVGTSVTWTKPLHCDRKTIIVERKSIICLYEEIIIHYMAQSRRINALYLIDVSAYHFLSHTTIDHNVWCLRWLFPWLYEELLWLSCLVCSIVGTSWKFKICKSMNKFAGIWGWTLVAWS